MAESRIEANSRSPGGQEEVEELNEVWHISWGGGGKGVCQVGP